MTNAHPGTGASTMPTLPKAAEAASVSRRPPIPKRLQRILCLDDFEAAAERHLPRPVFGYIAGAAETNRSLRLNRESFDEFDFVPRALVDVSRRNLETELLGQTYSAPFGLSPLGLSALSAYRGDIVMTRAAAKANVPMIMSGSSLIRLEEVAQENPAAWFQAYLPGDDAAIEALINRVALTNFKTLVITIDTPVAANRENNVRAGFSTPMRPSIRLAWQGVTHPRWLLGTFAQTLMRHGMPHFENNYVTRGAPILSPTVERDFSDRGHLNWRHLKMIRALWQGHLVVKGILSAEDACLAREAGADAIVVSNHGGRQLDGAVAPLRVLPGIVAACPDFPVMIDSGFRRGTDVIKALALGAKFVFIGRPFGYAAAVAGELGVTRAISLLYDEVSRDLAMLGVTKVADLREDRHLRRRKT